MPKARYPPSPYAIFHMPCLKAECENSLAQNREEEKRA